MIRPRADHADLDAILQDPTQRSHRNNKPLAAVEVIASTLAVDGEPRGIERDIDRAPLNLILGGALFDDAFVFGRTLGLGAGVG